MDPTQELTPDQLRLVNAAEDDWNTANANYATAEQNYNAAVNAQPPVAEKITAASAQYDNARNALAKATTDYKNAMAQVAKFHADAAKLAGSPELKAERQARADYYSKRASSVDAQNAALTARASSYETPEQRQARMLAQIQATGQNEQTLETQRQQGQSALETQRQTGEAQNQAALEAQRAKDQQSALQTEGQNRIQQIMAERDARIQEATQQAQQTQDLETLRASLQKINAESLANLNAELSRQTEAQKFELERPFKERTASVEEQRASTEAQRAAQEGAYQQGELGLRAADIAERVQARNQQTEMGYRSLLAKGLEGQSQQAQQLGMSARGGGVAPGMGAAIADPQRMMYEVLQEGLKNGMWNADRIPPGLFDQGAPSPAGQSDQGAPNPNSTAYGRSLDMNTGAPLPAGVGM